MYRRIDLSNKRILGMLKKYKGNVNTVRQKLNCSYRLVHDVKSGRRKDPGPRPQIKLPPPVEDPCTCCGFREKGIGKRYLCNVCFKEEGEAFNELRLNTGPTQISNQFESYYV